jgi:hypothetical protein
MITHILLSEIDLTSTPLLPEHTQWLERWLREIEPDLEAGNVSSSLCLQGLLSELVVYKKIDRDWLSIFEDHLTDEEGYPLAYSKAYAKRLYKFANQWQQTPIHAIHTRWWIEKVLAQSSPSKDHFAGLIKRNIQRNGWIYNPTVSPTRTRTRMKSEYLMSFTMGVEILAFYEELTSYQQAFEATLSNEPLRPYLSAEYFRITALTALDALNLAPMGLAQVIERCEAGAGYCDFSIEDKRDDYMGTAKRVGRDVPLHSPLATLYAQHLSSFCESDVQANISVRLSKFVQHIQKNPLDIPAFRIRDLIDIPFGTGISPLEVVAASALVHTYLTK